MKFRRNYVFFLFINTLEFCLISRLQNPRPASETRGARGSGLVKEDRDWLIIFKLNFGLNINHLYNNLYRVHFIYFY